MSKRACLVATGLYIGVRIGAGAVFLGGCAPSPPGVGPPLVDAGVADLVVIGDVPDLAKGAPTGAACAAVADCAASTTPGKQQTHLPEEGGIRRRPGHLERRLLPEPVPPDEERRQRHLPRVSRRRGGVRGRRHAGHLLRGLRLGR